MRWDLARLWHALASSGPHRAALRHGDLTITWRQFDTAAAAVAQELRTASLRRGDVAALCLPNRSEYLVFFAGALRCGVAPCGVNFRYRPGELVTLLRRIVPAVVFYDTADTATIAAIRRELPAVRLWCATGDGTDRPTLDARLLLDTDPDVQRLDSSAEDVLLKCTGGTTGAPVVVRWRVGDVLIQLNRHNPWRRHDLRDTPDDRPITGGEARLLVASPLMHGSGMTRALGALCAGGTVITMPGRSFHAEAVLDAAAHHAVDSIAIVGDAHALPLADALDAQPGCWPLPKLATITSSGAAWTRTVKQRLLRRLPHIQLVESLGATEATGLGFSVATASEIPPTGQFTLGPHAAVFRPDHTPAMPGDTGLIAVSWPHPLGLHPNGQLPAARFVHHDGRRYLLSGDHVRALSGGRFTFLGREDDCINTGGEKVYAPEVTEVLTSHPAVVDAAVFGLPCPRFGSTVAALLHLRPDACLDTVLAHARAGLASFKIPTVVLNVPVIPRTAAGKVDLAAARALITAAAPEGTSG